MNVIHTTQLHDHHHVVPLAIAGATAAVAAALLAGPVDLSFGGDDPATSTSRHIKHLSVVSAGATVGLCSASATRQLPSDVPSPSCRHVVVQAKHATAPPVPCFKRFGSWAGDVKRPLGCD
jgi:hypothetical protein